MQRSCPLVPAGHLKITNLYSKLRGKICLKYSRFEAKDSNIRILFCLQNSWIRIRIFEIRGKRFESESNPNIFDHLWWREIYNLTRAGAVSAVRGSWAHQHSGEEESFIIVSRVYSLPGCVQFIQMEKWWKILDGSWQWSSLMHLSAVWRPFHPRPSYL